jgi:hypothetical protein
MGGSNHSFDEGARCDGQPINAPPDMTLAVFANAMATLSASRGRLDALETSRVATAVFLLV